MNNTKRFKNVSAIYKLAEELNKKTKYAFDVKNAVSLITEAIKNKETIHIRGDYDVDGIAAMAILMMSIKKIGGNVDARAPLRFTEGFGLSVSMVEDIESGLLITVDNGIVAFDAVKRAKERGIKVIITDHHLPNIENGSPILPAADCIINPHIQGITGEPGYEYYDYCGAGIALKISEELLQNSDDSGFLDKLYAFAAIATKADVMPVLGDNRIIIKRGCEGMRRGNVTDGLYQLILANRIDINGIPDTIPAYMVFTGDFIGFYLAPCVNAISRLNDNGAEIALECFLSDGDNAAAKKLAGILYATNEQRKAYGQKEMSLIENILIQEGRENDCPVVIHLPSAMPGLIGLDAGKICESKRVPAIVICGSGKDCKGSCRSIDGVNMKWLLDSVSNKLIKYGGHEGAAGLSIKESDIEGFREDLIALCKKEGITKLEKKDLSYDVEIDFNEVDNAFDAVVELGPFGEGNEEPVFLIKNFPIKEVRVIKEKHIKAASDSITAIGFGMLESNETPQLPEKCDMVATLEYNVFRGSATRQINVKAFVNDGTIIYRSNRG